MPQKIYLIRHGETEYNKTRRLQGWLDIPLNDVGHQQAKEAAQKLVNHHFDVLYSSDLLRAHETATHISKVTKQKINQSFSLRETDMGIFAGWAWESEPDPVKEQLWQEFEHARDNRVLDWHGHDGESIGEMVKRISNFLSELSANHKGQHVGIVTHGGTINQILEYYQLKSSLEGFRMIGNGSVLVLTKQTSSYSLEVL